MREGDGDDVKLLETDKILARWGGGLGLGGEPLGPLL